MEKKLLPGRQEIDPLKPAKTSFKICSAVILCTCNVTYGLKQVKLRYCPLVSLRSLLGT